MLKIKFSEAWNVLLKAKQTRCRKRAVEQSSETANSEPRRRVEPSAGGGGGGAALVAMENSHPAGRGMPPVEV